MKKKTMIFLFLMTFLCFTSCDIESTINNSELTTQTTKIVPSSDATKANTFTSALPVYVPGSIHLISDEEIKADENWGFFPKYRFIYYGIDSEFKNIKSYKDRDENDITKFWDWLQKRRMIQGVITDIDEMEIVAFVKFFDISREDFEKAVEKQRKNQIEFGFDEKNESFELPNADIIYTFDNEIINDYYRRE